jgi:hypothetical protein
MKKRTLLVALTLALGIPHRCGCVALKVYNYRTAPRPTRTYEHGDAVYTFTAG